MNLDRYEKIDGREALKRLADGEHVFSKAGVEYKLNQYGFIYYLDDDMNDWKTSRIAFNQLIVQGFYIPKPFDVRQAMLDRPNEWVGAYKNDYEIWNAVGFETKHFNAVCKKLSGHLPVDTDIAGVSFPSPEELDTCIPIQDAPKEA